MLPELVKGHALFGDDGISASCAGEAGSFGKTPEFNRHLAAAFDFKDAVRDRTVAHKLRIRGIEEDKRFCPAGIFDPLASCSLVAVAPVGLFGKHR